MSGYLPPRPIDALSREPIDLKGLTTVSDNKKTELEKDAESDAPADGTLRQVKFEIYGEEMIEKRVKSSGNSGRVYLPPNWVGRHVKIIRID